MFSRPPLNVAPLAAAALLLLTAPAAAHTAFGPPSIEIHAEGYTQVLIANLSTESSYASEVFFGPSEVTLPVLKFQLSGAFLYNYEAGRFSEAFYSYDQEF